MGCNSVYLGNALIFSRNKAKDFFFLKERVNRRLEGWSINLLSKAGKATFIKSVVQAIPNYSMSTFCIPLGVCNDLDSIVRKFWWNAKPHKKSFIALKAWKDVRKPKSLEGFGFRRFKDINSALLAKLGWMLASNVDSLWTLILKAKYLRGKSLFETQKANGSSMVWQGILSARPFLRIWVCYKIGNGLKINPWLDPWV